MRQTRNKKNILKMMVKKNLQWFTSMSLKDSLNSQTMMRREHMREIQTAIISLLNLLFLVQMHNKLMIFSLISMQKILKFKIRILQISCLILSMKEEIDILCQVLCYLPYPIMTTSILQKTNFWWVKILNADETKQISNYLKF